MCFCHCQREDESFFLEDKVKKSSFNLLPVDSSVLVWSSRQLTVRLRANGRNNSQNCSANNVGSCCVHVGSGVQKDATTPNNVGTCSASWEGHP